MVPLCKNINSELDTTVKTKVVTNQQTIEAGATGSYLIGNFNRRAPLLLNVVASGTNREFGALYYVYRSNQYHYRTVELAKTQYSSDDKFNVTFTNSSSGLSVNIANTGNSSGSVSVYATFLHEDN